MLARAIYIAFEAHKGAHDKNGEPYIRHPMRVMEAMETDLERQVAVLHDVVEDTDWTCDDLLDEGFCLEVVDAVDAISKRKGEDNETYLLRVAGNDLARRVKLADLRDNMDLTRAPGNTPIDHARFEKYQRNWFFLKQGLPGKAKVW